MSPTKSPVKCPIESILFDAVIATKSTIVGIRDLLPILIILFLPIARYLRVP